MFLINKLMINDNFMYHCGNKYFRIMKLKDIITLGIFLIGGWLLMHFVIGDMEDSSVILYFILIPLLIFTFNFVMRKNEDYQGYFTSKYNFLTSKYEASITSDLPKALMFQKMVEVVENSNIRLVNSDENTLKIFATKGLTFQSWGENIYISFDENDNKTTMHFTSTTVVGIVSWGRNEKNYSGLLSNFEESLTI